MAITLFLLAGAAQAATITVTTTADNAGTCPGANCTLRQAIATAASGDTVVFRIPTTDPNYASAAGIAYVALMNGEIAIGKNLTIDGAGARIWVQCANPTYFRIFHITGGTVRILNLTIANGATPKSAGGGGGVRNSGSLTLQNCALSANFTFDRGGAIYNDVTGNLTVTNCSFVQNNAQTPGGGAIYNLGSLLINNSTLSVNDCGGGTGGGIANAGNGTVHVRNTIIAGNTGDADGLDVSGAFISDGYNFIGRVDSFSTGFGMAGSHDQVGSNANPADAKLGPLQDNGGLTQTLRPIAGSPVIDKGSRGTDASNAPINIDQRGFARPLDQGAIINAEGGDGSDIGALEAGVPQAGPDYTVTNTLERNGSCMTDDCTLLEAMNAANANANASTITFVPGVRGSIPNTIVPGGLNIVNPMTISGPGARLLTISGNNVSRVFNIPSGITATISGVTIANAKSGTSSGGGLANFGTLTLLDCAVLNNSGGSGGGAVNSGNLDVINCTFAGNQSTGNGGALRNGGTLRVRNSTFHNNTAVNSGAISSFVNSGPSAKVELTNCTVSGNKATEANGQGGGLFNGNLSTTTVRNTIVVFNSVPNANNGPEAYGSFSSGGHNLIRDPMGNNFVNGADGDLVGAVGYEPSPGLLPLQNNGGPTDTMALNSVSDARDKGNDLNASPTDQRGYVRSGISDMGAFEFNGFPAIPPSVTTGAATEIGSRGASLTATVNPNGLDTTVEFVTDFGPLPTVGAHNGMDNVLVKVDAIGLTPNTTYHYHAVATNFAGTSTGAEQAFTTLPLSPTPTPTPTPGLVGNVSTRLPVGTGDNALFEGFIVQGPDGSTKKIMVRAIGPSLLPFGVADALENPTLEIRDANKALIATNDDWVNTQVGGIITGDQSAEISGSSLAPGNNLESAIIAELAPGSYTAVVRGVGDTAGTGVVDAYDMSAASPAKLVNVATRGLIQPGDKLMIAGFIIQNGSVKAVVRAIGPSLSAFGVTNALPDTTLQLRDQNGAIVRENDDWESDQKAELEATGLQPSDSREAALVVTIPPGQYTTQVRGKPEATGIGVVQVYFLQ